MIPQNKKKFFRIINNAKINNKILCINFYFCFNKNFSKIVPEVILVMLFLSQSLYSGHTCIPIKVFKKKKLFSKKNDLFFKLFQLVSEGNKNWFDVVINSNVCSNGVHKTPLVLERKRLYIYKYWYSETKIIEFIYHQSLKFNTKNLKKYKKIIKKYCSKNVDYNQSMAIQKALLNKICFIIGGPGTGKTSILAYLVLVLIKKTKKKINIQLSASTGKAAAKLTQSIYCILNKKKMNKDEKMSYPKIGVTLHSLFNIQKKNNQCKNLHIKTYKKIDVLIIDECSMIDLNMMDIIVTNIKKKTKIIFVGDVNQLPPIENGSVLKEICNVEYQRYYKNTQFKKLDTINNQKKKKQYISILKKKYRFIKNSGLNNLINLLEKKKYFNISNFYKEKYPDIICKSLHTQSEYLDMLKKIKKYYEKYIQFLKKKSNPKKIIQKFNKYQVLCAVKKGIYGTKKINKYLDQCFFYKKKKNPRKKNFFYHGKPLLIKKNNTSLKLMNGDIGICLVIKNKIKVCFILPNQKIHMVDPYILFDYDSAWCITIHKSQGSEYSSVQVIIPNNSYSILSKELFYTAITRAKKKITIYSNKEIIKFMIKKKKKRYSGLSKKFYN
ncbi:exodeoxyribonuclease V subunit alpha [Buchnera aphidicola]|uniref:RecBCD enzyme subunit RecD n=1 Tax=Buchnera aphidicola (Cinara cf. splendens/pseudotsugae 3390) TaxID=2518980 RepID=A0A451CXZ3_9GAMM|nr:exodeoxyribonuclease V subunit alpha [Buchnera aphidicola]VFP77868.1 RecBCD enzyme subunit RecD [Buchnera aphidicola (Cinara cf. splendens/pseudotsugae 3390)]